MTQYVMKWTQGNKEALNVFDLFASTPPNPNPDYDGFDVGQKFAAILISALGPVISNETTLASITRQGEAPIEYNVNEPGTNVNPAAPINTCYLINKNPSAGRRGRMFLPGVVEDAVGPGGVLNQTTIDLLAFNLNGMITDMGDNGVTMRIIRNTGAQAQVVGFNADNLVATQRRRLRR